MDWVKLATRYYLDPAVANLPDANDELMFVRALAYAGAEETSGFIPNGIVPSLSRRRRYEASADALVTSGLWLPASGGFQISRWEEWQKELEAIAQRRSADRDRKRRERAAKKNDQINGMSRDRSTDSPQDSFSSLRTTTGGIESREGEDPPNPPQAGGHRSRCKRHKARPKSWCGDCQAPPLAPVPDWCRRCDERTRLTEDVDGLVARCPDCHPLAGGEAVS